MKRKKRKEIVLPDGILSLSSGSMFGWKQTSTDDPLIKRISDRKFKWIVSKTGESK